MLKRRKENLIRTLKAAVIFSGIIALCTVFSSCGKSVDMPIGNSINYGYVLVDGSDVYYSKIIETDLDYYSCIYKYNIQSQKDTLVSTLLADEDDVLNAFLTIEGGKLYFLSNYMHESAYEASYNISYIDLNSSDPSAVNTVFELDEISCRYMQIVNGVIYYYDDMEEMIYRMNLDGSNRKSICETYISSYSNMCVNKNSIYYAEDEIIYEVNVRGSEPKIIFDTSMEFEDDYFDIGYVIADGNYIYYMDYDKYFIQRISTNGTNNMMIYEAPEGATIESFNVSDGVVYFVLSTDEEYTIQSVVPGNQNAVAVVDSSHGYADILPLSIWDNTIYYRALPAYETIMDSDYVWFTVNKAGGPVNPMKPFTEFSDDFAFGDDELDEEFDEELEDEADENAAGEEVEVEAEAEN